jgi:LysM repeat protein
MLGAAAGGDVKGALLGKLAGATGVPNDILKQVSTGKFDVAELAKNANLTASLGDTAKAYLPGSVSNMIDGAKSAGRVVESADAYANDVQNQALDRAGLGRDQVKAIQDVKGVAQSAYQIAKGDTLAAIAKKQGTTLEALMAANPNIKDPNKIATGMKLNLPAAIPAGRQPETPEETAARRTAADAKVPGATPEPGFLDKAKDFFSGAGDKISGAVDAAGNFIKENPMLATGAIQAGAATAGYMAGDKARDEQQKLLEKQILETQGVDALKNYQQSKQREDAYAEQDKFQQDVIAGGGVGAKEREMQQQGQDRAARAAAAGRLAGIEQQARMGQGVTGAGSSLAASLAGAQAQSNAAAESERAAATSAAQNLKETYAGRASALESKAAADVNLASLKDQIGLRKVSEIGDVRTQQGNMAAQEGDAQGRLAAGLADIATRGVLGQQIGPSDATAKEREIAAQAKADQDKAALAAKANAAGAVSQSAPTQGNVATAGRAPATTPVPTSQADKFNQAGQAPKPQPAPQPGQGQGYGVLAPVENLIKNPSQAVKNPVQAVNAVQQIAKNPQAAIDEAKKKAQEAATAAAKKAVGGMVPDSMKNIFKF